MKFTHDAQTKPDIQDLQALLEIFVIAAQSSNGLLHLVLAYVSW